MVSLVLFVGTHAQAVYLFLCEVSPVATTKVLLCQSGKLYAVELGYLIAERLEYTSNNTVLAAVNLYAYLLLEDRVSILTCVGLDFSVFECDSITY